MINERTKHLINQIKKAYQYFKSDRSMELEYKDDIDFLNKNNLSNGFSYNLYLKIKDFINNKYEDFSFIPTKLYINILTPKKKSILSIIFNKSDLKIYFTLDNLNEYDEEKKLVDYKNIGH
ncbi:hypothetical protein oki361_16620 [Helicobacter pylori]